MTEINLTSPAVLFPAISLLMLAYTNRFLALAALIRNLHASYKEEPDELIIQQIHNLRRRLLIIRNMQAAGITSIFLCVLSMLFLFAGQNHIGQVVFGIGLLFLMVSLGLSLSEIVISVNALNVQLSDLEEFGRKKNRLGNREQTQDS